MSAYRNSYSTNHVPVDTGHKLNVHKTLRRRPGHLRNVLCTFNLRLVFTGVFTRLMENRINALFNKSFVRNVLMDPSVAFDCIPHDLFLAKLHAYGLGINTLNYLKDN